MPSFRDSNRNPARAVAPRPRVSAAARPRAASAVHVIDVDGLAVRVARKPIKNMYLRVTPPSGDVVVSAPTRITDAQIEAFVRQRRDWVVRQRRRIAEARGTTASGPGDPSAEVWTPERRRTAADAINAQLPALLAHWGPIIGRTPTHITLRTMTTRWGSCTPRTGRIRLNLQLGLMEPRFLEYVLVHEMTHLWASGHGVEFQSRMSRYLPQWRQLRRELNRYTAV